MSTNGQTGRSVRLAVLALLLVVVSFSAGVLGTLKYLSLPTNHTWTGQKLFVGKMIGDALANGFHNIWYNRGVWRQARWLGTPILQYPTDLLVYQEVIYDVKPDVILDIGTYKGASALYYANILDLMGYAPGRVISVDIELRPGLPQHPRISYLQGSSTSEDILKRIRALIRPDQKVLIFLDSDHSMSHVLSELRAYSPIVTRGSYIVVEDSNINGHPVHSGFGPGPMEAIHAFFKENSGFEVDRSRERYLLSVAPEGFLKKL